MAGSGSTPNPDEDRPSASPSLEQGKAASNSHILIVEDNPADVFLIRETIEASGVKVPVHIVKDGEEATLFFDHADRDDSAPCPSLVILDINLPKKHGIQVLQHLRRSHRCRTASVIVVSTSNAAKDREDVILNGADAFFCKPSKYDDFLKLADLILEWFPKGSK
jgi:two-component system, chemotaxis family, response regulator Rcp1